MFQSGRTSVVGEDRSDRSITSRTAHSVERVDALVQEDRRITVTGIADKVGISCRSAYSIIRKDLGYPKIFVRCVPKQLTDEHRRERVETCGNVHIFFAAMW
jgi:ribosomal protein S25